MGAASETFRRTGGGGGGGSVFMSDSNVRRLVDKLSRMRGAALKLGQFMSIQGESDMQSSLLTSADSNVLPPEIERVLQQVQANANCMPEWQMEVSTVSCRLPATDGEQQVMTAELGSDWSLLFSEFKRTPVASASIGQVHHAVLASTGLPVAVKIQFPGIKDSIASDLNNLSLLLRSAALLPKGLYLENTIKVMRRELEDECDYLKEAESCRRFRTLLDGDEYFQVPQVVDEASTGQVLTMEWMDGRPLSKTKNLSQETRNEVS